MNPIFLFCAGLLATDAVSQVPDGTYVPAELLVRFDGVSASEAAETHRRIGALPVEELSTLGVIRVQIPASLSVETAVRYYKGFRFVDFAEPNFIAQTFHTPNDSSFGSQWGPQKIQCPAGWDLSRGGSNIVISIVDTGIDLDHPDLAPKIKAGYDFVNNDNNADDDNGHGTHCAGIAASSTNNVTGIAGVGYQCSLQPVKVLNSSGSGSYSAVASGITWAADHGTQVISLSLGGSSPSSTLESAVNYAWNKGVVLVAAAGNNGNTSPVYPAYYTNCIAVASTDQNDSRSSFSNWGSWVEVAAPGSSIYSTYKGGGYTTLSGTSMATPHVSGEVGLLWSYLGTGIGNSTIRKRVEANTDYVGTFVTFGRINVPQALNNGEQTRKDFSPNNYTVLQGSTSSGGLTSILSSDNSRLEISSTTSGFSRYAEWYAKTNASISGTLISLEVTFEGNLSYSGTVDAHLYNWSSRTWDNIGSVSLTTNDKTVVFKKTSNLSAYVSSGGEMRAKLYCVRGWWSSFIMRTDLVKFTTTTQ